MPGFGPIQQEELARALKKRARELGFMACGISTAGPLDEEARQLESWLARGMHGTMRWMENHFDKRIDPTKLVPGARTVISVLDTYWEEPTGIQGNRSGHAGVAGKPGQERAHAGDAGAREQPRGKTDKAATSGLAPGNERVGQISRYARGDDYHVVMKERLALLYDWLDKAAGGIDGRAFVDSAPVMDKAWARRAGLGWIGKHTNLITQSAGSWYFIGELIVDVPLPPDGPTTDHCGTCTRCIDACPTDAITAPYQLDANRCISYLTIEYRGDLLPEDTAGSMGDWIYGCDVCQEVCPWNRFRSPVSEPRYRPREGVADTSLAEWEELDLETYRALFRHSAVKRTKYAGLMRNIRNAVRAGR